MSSSLHKIQAAQLPNAQHPHPGLLARPAANSLFDFIGVLKTQGQEEQRGRNYAVAFVPPQLGGLSAFIHPPPGPKTGGELSCMTGGQLPPPKFTR